MEYISILEQSTKELIRVFGEKKNLTSYFTEDYQHPQEDYLLTSDSPAVFVVSDGVTLNFMRLIETNAKYPNPSPAGDVSRIFCESVISSVQGKYNFFDEKNIVDVFREANSKVRKYNQEVGKSNISGNITGYYAATGSFVVIKDEKAYWASICDAFVAHFDKNMNLKFMSSGSCTPYAVINGEEKMSEYIESGIFNLEQGDRIFVFSDGFEYYSKNQDFLELFKEWNEDLKERIKIFSKEMNLKDPEKYGHERSLVAILV